MILLDTQMSITIIKKIIDFINNDAVFNTFSTIIAVISFFQEALEHYREKKWRKTFYEAILLCIVLVALCQIGCFSLAILIVSILLLGMRFIRRINCNRTIKANIEDKTDTQVKDILADSTEGDYFPRLLDFSDSAFKNAEQCLAENRPKAAIHYLNECRGKEKNQLRFVTRYADALVMLENYEGALAKLNTLSAKQIKKKKRYKSVMIRKAVCYYCLNRYIEELNCYDKVIASNYKPKKYYYYRGKVKTRLLAKYPYVKAAQTLIFQTYESKQNYIESALADFDKALSYGDKYKAKILSYRGSCYFHLQEQMKALDFFYESEELKENFENNHVYFGIYFYEAENFDAAKIYLEKGIAYGATDELPHLYLARISYKEKMYDEAILHATKALSFFPQIDECYYIQGNCYIDKNMFVEAIACYTQAIALNPKEEYFKSRARCYYNKSDPEYKKAHDDILAAIKLNNSEYNRLKEMLYLASMDKEEGRRKKLDELERLIQPYSKKSTYYNDIGIIFIKYGYMEEAEKYYNKDIEYNKDSSVAHYNLAILLWDIGRQEEAVKNLEEAVALDPMNLKYLEQLETYNRDLGNTDKEIEIQIKISILKKKYLKVNKENGDAVYQLGKYYSAEKYYRSALEYVPHDPATLNNLACVLYYQEKYDEAIECLQQAVMQEGSHLAYFNLGNCYLRINDLNNAITNYRTSQKISSEFEPARQMLQLPDPAAINMVIDGDANP